MRFLVSGFWVQSGTQFNNYIVTSEKSGTSEQDDDVDFCNMDEQDIIDSMSPNERYPFIITSYRAL